eukprot:CAMPEP_0171604272 /NCGR_PEP_ID=MMETSP0990-20121206/6514_1 /TAXON_ID=483369 /ORGANISM="non described non described, Strain CCMP2098" /LENGTH=92 /DNA_ID=CAMNT_0012166777 /DNA_START=153 /DNA_END=428 /DNA_ORIENTATION=-
MIHFHIKGGELSVFNTHVLCLIKGDDSEEEYRACDVACGLRAQYDHVCLHPKRYKLKKGDTPHLKERCKEFIERASCFTCMCTRLFVFASNR